MGKGKYSPFVDIHETDFSFNARGEKPVKYTPGVDTFNPEIHCGGFDKNGYDTYGYSAYNANGKYVGACHGVDRSGRTELDYLTMTDEEYVIVSGDS